MRCSKLSLTVALAFLAVTAAQAGDLRIIKVLPHYLDKKGRHTLSPSLYERDAYQAHLRKYPNERSGMRFDIQWKVKGDPGSDLKLKVEIRGGATNTIEQFSFEQPIRKDGWGSSWSAVTVAGKDYKKVGDIIAWRATLWDGNKQVAEQKSYMW